MPAKKVRTLKASSCSCSSVGVLAMGENPTAWMPRARKKRLSVAAGKISRSTPIVWTAEDVGAVLTLLPPPFPPPTSSPLSVKVSSPLSAVTASGLSAVTGWASLGMEYGAAGKALKASSNSAQNGFESRSTSVSRCACKGLVHGAKLQLKPSSAHHSSSISLKSEVASEGQIRTSNPASASVGMTLSEKVLPPSQLTPVRSMVTFRVVTSPSLRAWACLQPSGCWFLVVLLFHPSASSCSCRNAKAFCTTPMSLLTAVFCIKRLPWPVGPAARTRSHQGVRSP
mmetsp:Transcript_32679/g.66706  ORF Transcript_32679/g.66706 Transcript_32679/m.66706 type:complete len:284 (-) Transcript_32679:921-1772(-)